ncbi:MAG: YbfB/YjiJ family MFS transporter [Proteobacteria bacterium]|nr:YbfB/YjiJ family MFS transporter [Pseudomonadota bacterium]
MNKSAHSLAVGGLLAMASAVGIGRFVYTPILPPMVEALHLSKSQAGLIASANFIGYLAGALLAAVKLPGTHRAWLLIAMAANVLCLGAMGLTTDMAGFLALRAVAGFASAFGLIFASALVLNRLQASGHGTLSAVHFAGVGTGIAAASALVAWLAFHGGDWRDMWFASAALALAASIAVAILVPPDARTAVAPAGPKTRLSRGFWFLLVAYGLFGFGYIITATFIVQMVRGSPQIAALEPYIFILFGLSAAPSVAFWTWLARRSTILRTFALACATEAVGVAASALFLSPATVILTSVFVGGTFMGLTALGLLGAREGGGDPRGRIALMTASFSFGQILGPLFAGHVYDLTNSLAVPSLAAAAALLIAAALSLRRPT